MILKYFIAIHMKCNIYKKNYLNAQKMHSSLNICHLLSANSLPLIEIFSPICLLFIKNKQHCFTKARSIFMDCQKKFQITLKNWDLSDFCQFFKSAYFLRKCKLQEKFLCGWIQITNVNNVHIFWCVEITKRERKLFYSWIKTKKWFSTKKWRSQNNDFVRHQQKIFVIVVKCIFLYLIIYHSLS